MTDNRTFDLPPRGESVEVINGTNFVFGSDGKLQRLTIETNGEEVVVRTISYDDDGRVVLVDDGTNGCVTTAYDAAGNVSEMTGPGDASCGVGRKRGDDEPRHVRVERPDTKCEPAADGSPSAAPGVGRRDYRHRSDPALPPRKRVADHAPLQRGRYELGDADQVRLREELRFELP